MANSLEFGKTDEPVTDDTVIDQRIGILLRVGMLLSAFVVLIGGILYLAQHGRSIPDYHVFHGAPPHLSTLSGIALGAIHGNDLAVIQLGLLLLIATPVARVAFSVGAFALQKDFLYVVISAMVLAVLLYSLFWH